MIKRTLMTLAVLACFMNAALPANASDDPGKIDSHLADDHADLQAWASQGGDSRSTTDKSAGQASTRAVRVVRTYVPACEGNWPDSPNSLGTLCPRAIDMCAGTPDPDDLGFWIFTAPASSAQTAESWSATGESTCRGPGDDEDPTVQPVVTAEDFRRLPLPAAKINVQPPNRRTLINIPTNFYTDAAPVVLPTTVLGQPVRVRATPMRFRWTYGDGAALTTADPGAPYPDLRTSHTYRQPGERTLGLTTTYSGEYSVAGGAWLPIDGLATVTSPGTALTVLAARNELVADPMR
jgi:hypothetical protein